MTSPRLPLLAAALLLASPSRAAEPLPQAEARPVDPEERATAEEIRELMALTGAAELGVQVGSQVLLSMRKIVPGAPDVFWKKMAERLRPDALVELTLPLYRKYLTSQDVRDMVAFYSSPVGRKLVRVMPALAQESMAAGRAWGEQIAREIVEEARARGYEVKT